MATYRAIYLSFWTDAKVDDDFTPEDKYFFLYLLTNPHTNICGCYEVTPKQMARETGYNEDSVKRLLDRMEKVHGVIKYDSDTKEVLIPNWGKYNWHNSPKTMAGAEKVAQHIKSETFKKTVADTLSIGYGYPMDISVSVLNTTTTPISKNSTDNHISNTVVEEYFDTFWREYPRKVGKGDARKKFAKALTKTSFDNIMAALQRVKASAQWQKDDGQFVPHPATWLNQERWDDEVGESADGLDNLRNLYAMCEEEEHDKI